MNNLVLQVFDEQRARGTEGFGLYDGDFNHIIKATNEDAILKWLVKYPSSQILFHHRWPTSTDNVKRAAHPFTTKDYFGKTEYILVHNGRISNDYDLFDEHQERGIEYHTFLEDLTFNDSEALLWDLALTLEGKQDAMKAKGDMAFILLKLVDGVQERMYFGRNSERPLNIYRDDEGLALSSEGDGVSIETDVLFNWNLKLRRLTQRAMLFPKKPAPIYVGTGRSEYAGFPYDDYDYGDGYKFGYVWDDDTATWLSKAEVEAQRAASLKAAGLTQSETFRNVLSKSFFTRNPLNTMLPMNATAEGGIIEEIDTEDDAMMALFQPYKGEVETAAMEYMMKAHGHFEQAYWLAEADYDEWLDVADTSEAVRQRLLLEGVMHHIGSDPEYKTVSSVSSIWEALWFNA